MWGANPPFLRVNVDHGALIPVPSVVKLLIDQIGVAFAPVDPVCVTPLNLSLREVREGSDEQRAASGSTRGERTRLVGFGGVG